MMNTSLRLAALAAMALVHFPAYADMTVRSSDGSMELALPNGGMTLSRRESQPRSPLPMAMARE